MGIKDLFSKEKVEPKVLIESNSPNCNIQAIVEEDNRCVYFYLFGQSDSNDRFMNPCWVRNYEKAPKEVDVQAMQNGYAPMLPSDYCAHPNGAEKLDASKLEIVWFEEGDGAALLYNNEILSVIPGWAGPQFSGYSRDCVEESQFAWPLGNSSENVLYERVRKAKEFWDNWNDESWGEIQTEYLATIEKSIGKYEKYYAIDGGHWPPKAMVTIEKDDLTYIITMGVSVIPQPKVEMYFEEPKYHRRFELGFVIETELLNKNRNGILSYISAQTTLPWTYLTWLGHGHTIPCNQISSDLAEFPYVLLVNNKGFEYVPDIKLPLYREDEVNILWMVPLTIEEKKYAEDKGSECLIEEHLKDSEELWIFRGKSKFNI
ncbi:Suppressor of fused protein (SUFU) [Clostridium cavendishii DSM 21758]|uniref:Suppressor of fused protein (SUFU) n=1 Tax=Clostridium cavendishii DSM 21758 TaxID=1121302 RepID=A0A1M6GQH9_9CLOT|nr:suppressor of fused domain protein [Clostridium cavendishii]SHJ12140.1 Suppressor of fused protein (SUFU) [Clostridium cavendishii DSM 21758]